MHTAVPMSAVFSSFQPKWKSQPTHEDPFRVTEYHKTCRKIKALCTLLMKHICHLTAWMRDRLSLCLSFFRKTLVHHPFTIVVHEWPIDHCFCFFESPLSLSYFLFSFPLVSLPAFSCFTRSSELKRPLSLSQVPVSLDPLTRDIHPLTEV